MVQIVPRTPSFGDMLGQGLAQGLATGFQRMDTTRGLQALGYSRAEAKKLSALPESVLKQALKNKGSEPLKQAQANLGAWEAGYDQLPGLTDQRQVEAQNQPSGIQMLQQEQEAPQQHPQQKGLADQLNQLVNLQRQNMLSNLMGGQQQSEFGQPPMSPRMQMLEGVTPRMPQEALQRDVLERAVNRQIPMAPEVQQIQQQLAQPMPSAPDATAQQQIAQPMQAAQQQAFQGRTPQEYMNKAREFAAMGDQGTAKVLIEQAKLKHKEQSELLKEQREDIRESFKQTKEERQDILKKAQSARQNLQDLDRMDELQKEGKLDTPGYLEFLKRVGMDIPALMNPGSQEFQKIQQTFMRDAKTYLGARISNFELDQFMKTIPSLSQSPEGRQRVIANLKRFNRVALEYNKARKEVMTENRGVPPLDLLEKIDDRIENKLDYVAKQFRDDLNKPVPKGQNKLITALQAGLGSVIGFPGSLVKSAGSKFLGEGAGAEAAAML